jgi:hypothetical protein
MPDSQTWVANAARLAVASFALISGWLLLAPRASAASEDAPPGHSERALAIGPLTLANVVVTDLASGHSTYGTWSNAQPLYGENCNTSAIDPICMIFGGGVGSTSGGSLDALGYQNNDSQYWSLYVSVNGFSCQSTSSKAATVDQYVWTPTAPPLQAVALRFDCSNSTVEIAGTVAFNFVPKDLSVGYYLFGGRGELSGFGNDSYLSYLDGARYYNLNSPIVGAVLTPDGSGYWMVGSDGGIFASGDAGFYGSTGSLHLNKPVVGMASTPDGGGYWFVASDGGIFAYGDAQFYGSTGGKPLNDPIVGMAATPDGKGYWLVASDGGIFAFGDAGFYGSTGSLHLNKPVVGMASTPDGGGYWLVASDGGIFAYGGARFYGSSGTLELNAPVVGMAATRSGGGYWLVASDGGLFSYGDANYLGSLGGGGANAVAGMFGL